MSATTIIKPDGNSLTFDITEYEDFSPRVMLSAHPIEDGSNYTDHAQLMPQSYRARCLITETPFAANSANLPASGPERVQIALDFLKSCVGQRLSIQTVRRGILQNMQLESWNHRFTVRRDISIDLECQEALIAKASSVAIKSDRRAVKPVGRLEATATPSESAGNQAPQVITNKKATSTLHRMSNGLLFNTGAQ